MPTKRILTIDGGGIKGTFPAAFLAALEEGLGEAAAVGDYFDLIAGTSTGGIIALALGLGFSAREIAGFYREYGPQIFPMQSWDEVKQMPRRLFKSKYSHDQLQAALERLLGERTLADSARRLVIPAFNIESGEVYVFKTAHHPQHLRDREVRAVDVGLATASAPTFYPAHRLNHEIPLVDGAVWANNPISLAVAEGVGVLGWQADEISVLSLGCTRTPYAANWARNKALGVAYWAWNAPELFMTSQSSGAEEIAALLIGRQHITRINPTMPHHRYGLDKSAEIDSLAGLGKSEAHRQLPLLRELFFDAPAAPFRAL